MTCAQVSPHIHHIHSVMDRLISFRVGRFTSDCVSLSALWGLCLGEKPTHQLSALNKHVGFVTEAYLININESFHAKEVKTGNYANGLARLCKFRKMFC